MGNTRKANWTKWQQIPDVKLWEAIALSLDIDPNAVKWKETFGNESPLDEGEEFDDRIEILERNILDRKYFSPNTINMVNTRDFGVSLSEFAVWAQSINWEIPQELADLTNEGQTISTTNSYSGFHPDTKWEDMTWTLLSNEMVRIEAKGIHKRRTFSDLGFTDRRKGDTPNSRWGILKRFAEYNGEITWNTNIENKEKNTMSAAVKDIRKKLKVFFDIDDDPFHPYRKTKSYKTKFTIKDNRHYENTDDSEPEGF